MNFMVKYFLLFSDGSLYLKFSKSLQKVQEEKVS